MALAGSARQTPPWLEPAAVLAAAAIAALGVFIATDSQGPQVTTDSVIYLSTADNLRVGHGLISYDGVGLTTFPPGFPVVVAGVAEVAGGSLLGARILNSLCLGLIVVLGWMLMSRHIRSKPLRVCGVAGIAGAPTLFVISSAAWSEPLFVALVLASVLALELALERVSSFRWVAAAGLLASLAFSVRYVGLWLVVSGPVVLLIANRKSASRRRRVQRAALFLLVASVVPALVVQRNLRLTDGHPLGRHGTAATSLSQNVADAIDGVAHWFVPDIPASELRAELLVALLAALAAWAVRRRSRDDHREPSLAPLWPLALLAAAFVAFLVASASTAFLDPIGPRLLSPAFVPIIVVAFAGLDRLLSSRPPRAATVAAVAGVSVMWLGAQAQLTRIEFSQLRHLGAGYTEPRWQNSQLVSLVKRRAIRPAFSNYTDAWFFLTKNPAGCWPSPNITACGLRGPRLKRLRTSRPAYLAWFTEPRLVRPYVPPALRPRLRLTEIAVRADGALYRVSLRASP